MKKIGLLTYHASHNYGSVLQSYAMLNLLKNKFGNKVEIINYSNLKQQELYSLFVKFDTFRHWVRNTLVITLYPLFKKREKAFEIFIKNELNPTNEQYEECDELVGIEKAYDILVVGSDQVWNTSCIDFDDSYFLPFAKDIKKVAYAPSLGGNNILDNSDDEVIKYKKFLTDFDCISVREKNGKKTLEELTGRNIELVLDPTLCVEPQVWHDLVSEREIEGDYIFYYGGIYHPKTYDAVKYISKKLNMPVVTIDFKSYILKGGILKGLKVAKDGSPNNYLSLIKNANYVVTNSFHGSIFSTIFNKDFWVLTFKSTNTYDDRIDSLLEQLGFSDRKIFIEDIEGVDLNKRVNYDIDFSRLNNLRQTSLNYLEESLKD